MRFWGQKIFKKNPSLSVFWRQWFLKCLATLCILTHFKIELISFNFFLSHFLIKIFLPCLSFFILPPWNLNRFIRPEKFFGCSTAGKGVRNLKFSLIPKIFFKKRGVGLRVSDYWLRDWKKFVFFVNKYTGFGIPKRSKNKHTVVLLFFQYKKTKNY